MESLHAIKTGKLLVLAPQLLIDCVESEKKFGWVDKSFDWVISSSGSCMSLEKDYPYVGLAGPCMRNIVPVQPICIDNHAYITYASDDQMMQVVAKQPVVVGIKGCYAFNSYTDAIYRAPEVEVTNHFIVLIGYDTINGVDCWIGRNSWGEKWGMNGYVYIERLKGSRVGVGGINLLVQYPTFGARPYRKMRGRSEEKLRKFDGLDEILIKEKVKRHPGTKLQQMNLTNDQIMSSFITDVFPLFYPPSLPFIETEENTLSVQVQQLSDRHLTDQELELNFLVIMGLLVKLVENDASNRSWLAAVSIVLPASEGLEEESHRDVISLLHSIFLTNQEAGDASEEGNTESWDDEAALLQEEKEVEKMIVQAYAVLLLAFLSTESNGVRDAIANCQTSTELHSIRVLNVYFVEALYSLRTRILSGRE
ncbi:hypothetical protein HS088_TW12G00197 [Tripterygium wilfordii]|uniref:Peptidase C1A papain C-terminal domain-containing protein n=2 Tax=Tripterygium wilfordii TaxID=458696 RepID=A0A7J7CY31_TRIWF|nr:hypothetical protein HS088_TW12G00197 [Tripterygium wilfordii]